MAVRSPPALPGVSPEEMRFLIARTGLTLNAGQAADLVLAWRQLCFLSAAIPRRTILADDAAFAFRLPLPAPGRKAAAQKSAPAKPALAKSDRARR